jgi:glycosyltransferase involved in cell wall biosynthesis
VLVDAHEYSPGELANSLIWHIRFGRHYDTLCRRFLPRAAAMTTVCAGIAAEYEKNYGVTATVIENAPPRQDLTPSPVQPGRIRMIHHGGALRARQLELMIDVMKRLDQRFSLDFMLVPGDAGYLRELREKAFNNPQIKFVSPVEMPDICCKTNEYDIGLFLLPPVNVNYRFALPNKLFEFIQARLAVAIGPSPEMARVVREHGVGVVADSFDPAALADALNRLTEHDVMRYKLASHAAADKLCFEAAADRLLAIIEQLLPGAVHGTRPSP